MSRVDVSATARTRSCSSARNTSCRYATSAGPTADPRTLPEPTGHSVRSQRGPDREQGHAPSRRVRLHRWARPRAEQNRLELDRDFSAHQWPLRHRRYQPIRRFEHDAPESSMAVPPIVPRDAPGSNASAIVAIASVVRLTRGAVLDLTGEHPTRVLRAPKGAQPGDRRHRPEVMGPLSTLRASRTEQASLGSVGI